MGARTTRRWRAAAVALLVAFAAANAGALPGGPPDGREPGGKGDPAEMISRHAEELGLDDETRERLLALVAESRERGEVLRFELQEAHQRLHFLLSRDEPDEAAIMEQAERIGRIRIEESKLRLGTLLGIRGMLTLEQRERLEGLRDRMKEEGPFGRVREACRPDRQRLCPDVPEGPEAFSCMREHRAELSPECSGAVRELRERGRGRFDRGPGGPGF